MNRLTVQLKQIKEELGWQGMSGIALLLLAGVFFTFSLNPLEQQNAKMRSQLEAAHPKSSNGAGAFGAGDQQQETEAFFDSLPEENDVTDTLAKIYAIASRTGVELKQVGYRLDDKDSPRVEYGMSFPMTGDYARIRAFLSGVLTNNPAVSLDQVNFQRERISDTTLKADVRMTIFLRPTK
jgi:Tfp pilus assembly protein PilO